MEMTFGARLLDRPQTLRARALLFQVHLWAGLAAGLYAIVIGWSGSIIVFRESLWERQLDASRPVAPQAAMRPIEDWVAAARTATAHQGPLTIELPVAPDRAVEALVYTRGAMHFVLIDPYTSRVILDFSPRGSAMQWIDQLHSNFFLGRTGRVINGIGALVLLVLAFTGALLWWPGRALFGRRTRVDFGASWRRVNFDLHHAIGFWSLAGFVVLCVTGAFFTWPQWYRAAVARFFAVESRPPVRLPDAGNRTAAPMSAWIAAAERAAPGSRVWRLEVPGDRPAPVRALERGDGEPAYRTQTTVHLDPYTAEVLRVDRYDRQPLGNRILSWIGPLHAGNFGGWPVRLLYALLGLVFPALFLTGFLMWWQRVVRRRLLED